MEPDVTVGAANGGDNRVDFFEQHIAEAVTIIEAGADREGLAAATGHLLQAVTVDPRQVDPDRYAAAVLQMLGMCRADDLDEVLAAGERARAALPADHTLMRFTLAEGLGMTYLTTFELTGRPERLTQAAELYDEAVALSPREPLDHYVSLCHDCAVVHRRNRIDRAQHLEAAIAGLETLVAEEGERLTRAQLASIKQELGTCYQERLDGEAADNQERSVTLLEEALDMWDRSDPEQADAWASVANNLANTFWKRVRGDKGENLDRAIAYAEDALTVRLRAKDPVRWARTVHILGGLYVERSRGDKATNRERAIEYSVAAMEVETRDRMPGEWSGAQCNLGNAYADRVLGDRLANLDAAVQCFRAAIEVTPKSNLQRWSDSYLGLGNALQTLAREAGAGPVGADELAPEDLFAEAVEAYAQARAGFETLGWADREAASRFGLAASEASRAGHDSAERAVAEFERCLAVWDGGRNPLRALEVYKHLALLQHSLDHPSDAYASVARAVDTSDLLYGTATADQSRVDLLEDSNRLYRLAVEYALDAGVSAGEVWALAERSRSRRLRDEMVRVDPGWDIPPELLDRERSLIAARRRAWDDVTVAGSIQIAPVADGGGMGKIPPATVGQSVTGFDRIFDLGAQLVSVWAEIETHPGGRDFVAERSGVISWAGIRAFVDGEVDGFALVEYEVLDREVVAFVLRQGAAEPVMVRIPVTTPTLIRAAQALYREMDGSSGAAVRRETWDRKAEPLVSAVQPFLDGVRVLCLVPHLMLHHLPLHTLGPPGATLADGMVVYHAPSAALAARLGRSRRRVMNPGPLGAVVVADSLSDLPHAREEGEYVSASLGVDPLLGPEATRAEVLARLSGADVAHFACHGVVRVDWPPDSSVVLADGRLSAAELQESRLAADLLVLSGCDTGFQPFDRTLDASGIPTALLAAGARSLVVGLWTVDDQATCELFTEFYRRLADLRADPAQGDETDRSVAGVLRHAQLALRQHRPERYFWAPFVTVGAW